MMEIIVGIIVIAVVVFLCFHLEKDKKRVEGLVDKKIEKSSHDELQATNNVVYVAKDKEEEEMTSFALALKDAMEQLEREEKRKKRERQLERTRRQEAIRQQQHQQQADCVTSYAQSFEAECIDDSKNRYNDTSSSSSYSSGSSYSSSSSSSSSSYDSSSSSSSSSDSSSSSSSWD